MSGQHIDYGIGIGSRSNGFLQMSVINRDCLGCIKENDLNSRCLIFKCAVEKNIQYCIQCMEFPCKFMQGISKAYCPVFTEIKSKIKMLSYIMYATLQQDREIQNVCLNSQIDTN